MTHLFPAAEYITSDDLSPETFVPLPPGFLADSPFKFVLCSSLGAFCLPRLSGTTRDFLVVGSDSGRLVILDFDNTRKMWKKLHQETYGKSGCRRVVPGQVWTPSLLRMKPCHHGWGQRLPSREPMLSDLHPCLALIFAYLETRD